MKTSVPRNPPYKKEKKEIRLVKGKKPSHTTPPATQLQKDKILVNANKKEKLTLSIHLPC